MKTLLQYANNIYSQNGEDGILAEILRRLNISTDWFAEFGAWDGPNMSNTWRLAEAGWSGVYIEADQDKFKKLKQNVRSLSGEIICINAMVQSKGDDSLDTLLSGTKIPKAFALLSIDIDSDDYFVWESLTEYSPAIVVIEINSSFSPRVKRTHRAGALRTGSSFASTLELGRSKGYTLVCHTGNMIFVRNDLVGDLKLPSEELSEPFTLFVDTWQKKWPREFPFYLWRWVKSRLA